MNAGDIPGLEGWIRREALAWFLAGNVEGAEDLLAVARCLA